MIRNTLSPFFERNISGFIGGKISFGEEDAAGISSVLTVDESELLSRMDLWEINPLLISTAFITEKPKTENSIMEQKAVRYFSLLNLKRTNTAQRIKIPAAVFKSKKLFDTIKSVLFRKARVCEIIP
jgi:hypothetical protein